MNIELCEAFSNAIFPDNSNKRDMLYEDLKSGRFKEFEDETMLEAVNFYATNKYFPKVFCEDAQAVLPTNDKQNFKILAHVAGCECCSTKTS